MSLCKSFGSKLRKLLSKIDTALEKLAPVVLKVTTGIKNFLISPAGDVLTAIIPGQWDNQLRDVVVKNLVIAIDYLNIIETCKDKTGNEKILCFIEELKKKSPKVRDSLLIKLASILAGLLHDNKLDQHEYDTFIQLQYSLQK